ncbi:MAG: hypothetical protein AAGA06_03165, partial [Pseudomonadota bacterium]
GGADMDWLRQALAAAFCVAALPAVAEWQASVTSYAGVRFAAATDPSGTLTIRCAAPDPTVASPGQAGTPYNAKFELSGSIYAPDSASDRMTATLVPDDTGYQFPVSVFDAERDLWPMPVAMSDPSLLATLQSERLVLYNGRGKAWQFSTEGLEAAVSATFRACVEGWRAKGHTIPPALAGFAPPETALARADHALPQNIARRVTVACNGPFELDPANLLTGLIDSDQATDYVLNWNDVRCSTGMARPLCGAANCSIDVYLSSLGYRYSERDALLGIAPALVPLSNGRMGITMSGTGGICDAGRCNRPFWWDGTRLRN